MSELSYIAAQEHFFRITGITADKFEYSAVLNSAMELVRATLTVSLDSMSDFELCACEYAAAAAAAYEYAFEECIREKPVMSENGEVSVRKADNQILDSAYLLRQNAFSQLAALGLCDSQSFAFISI